MVPWFGVIVVFPDHTYVLFVFSSTTTLYISSLKWVHLDHLEQIMSKCIDIFQRVNMPNY